MKTHASTNRRAHPRPAPVTWAVVTVAVMAMALLLPPAARAAVGFYSGAYAKASATGSTSVSVGTTFPDAAHCSYPAIVVRVAIRNTSAAKAPTVTSVTWTVSTGQSLAFATGNYNGADDSQRKRTEIWYLTGPASGAGTALISLSGAADVAADLVAACSVNQSSPVQGSGTSFSGTQGTDASVYAPSTQGGLVLDVLAVESGITASTASPSRTLDMNPQNPGGLNAFSSHYTDTTTNGFVLPHWTLGTADYWVDSLLVLRPYQPTRVGLSDLRADSVERGAQVSWRTGFEAENLGFRVYRDVNGARVPITNGLIAGSALSFRTAHLEAGYSYAWRDPSGKPGDRYWLESVDLSGHHAWHGPATVATKGAPRLVANSALITQLGLGSAQGGAAQRALRPVVSRPFLGAAPNRELQGEIAAGKAAKIVVREDGWYRVTFRELTDAGFPVDASDSRTLQLYTDGVEQAIEVTSQASDINPGGVPVQPSDEVEFYGTAADTPYTDGRVYWLVSGSRPGLRIQTAAAQMFRAPQAVSFPYTVEHKERSLYVMGIINGDKQNFWGRFIGSDGVDQALVADHIDVSGKSVVEVNVQGLGVPHDLQVSLNGTVLGKLSLAAWQAGSATFDVPAGVLLEGENTLHLATSADDAYSLFDTVRLTYPRWSSADHDALVMGLSQSAPRDLRIDGFSQPAVRVVDVTLPGQPVELAGEVTAVADGYAVGVHTLAPPRLGGQRVLLAFSSDQIKQPAAISANVPSRWHNEVAGADVVIITPRTLESAVAPLVALRRSQGHTVAVVDVEDVYDEYSFGMKSPQAIRDFLQGAAQHWQTAPRFVLLFGNATYDPRNYLGYGGDLVPTMQVDTAEMEAPSDDWFVDFDGDGVPNIAIGRLPVENAAQASEVVAKLLSYEESNRSFQNAFFIADASIGSNFELINSHLLPLLPSTVTVQEANVGDSGIAAVRTQLLSALADGVDLVEYAGHGSVDHLRGGLLTTADATSLGNADHPTVFTMLNCLVGMFDDPTTVALGKALVNAPNGGAVAVWASSGTTVAPDQEALMAGFLQALQDPGSKTLGEAIATAKAAASNDDVKRTWIFLGDPATALR